MEISINNNCLDLCETDDLVQAVSALKAEIGNRAQAELRELDAKRDRLLSLLSPAAGDTAKPATAKSNGNGKSPPKYRDPDSGKTWTGKGKRPAWFDVDRAEEYLLAD